MARENDEGKVGPWRLVLYPLRQLRCVFPEQTFFGKQNCAYTSGHLADEFRQTSTIDRLQTRATEKVSGSRAIPSNRSEDEHIMISFNAHSAGPFGRCLAEIMGIARENAAKFLERWAELYTRTGEAKFTNGMLVMATALLHDR